MQEYCFHSDFASRLRPSIQCETKYAYTHVLQCYLRQEVQQELETNCDAFTRLELTYYTSEPSLGNRAFKAQHKSLPSRGEVPPLALQQNDSGLLHEIRHYQRTPNDQTHQGPIV